MNTLVEQVRTCLRRLTALLVGVTPHHRRHHPRHADNIKELLRQKTPFDDVTLARWMLLGPPTAKLLRTNAAILAGCST